MRGMVHLENVQSSLQDLLSSTFAVNTCSGILDIIHKYAT